jgi:hypothetical protein
MTDRRKIKAIQDEYERNTGERPSYDVATVFLDRRQEAETYHEDINEIVAYELAHPISDPLADACENCIPGGYGRMCYRCDCETGSLAQWERENGHN